MAPQTYGLPIWARAKASAFSALVAYEASGAASDDVPVEVPVEGEEPVEEPLFCC
ncbi:hypothetical protein SMICM304S_00071 [Streptomyces microflavus]